MMNSTNKYTHGCSISTYNLSFLFNEDNVMKVKQTYLSWIKRCTNCSHFGIVSTGDINCILCL